jgi:hypothetical protein
MMNVLLAAVAYVSWRRATSDRARLTLWLVCVSESFVAAGYLCFSGATGFGDLGPGGSEGIGPLRMPMLWRTGEFLLGIAIYGLLVAWANRTLSAMIGNGAETRTARQTIALGYYATTGVAALLTGLLNPVGAVVTVMSAAASSFGGQAGLISVAFATRRHGKERPFVIGRNWAVFVVGAVVLIAFAAILGPSVRL